jgi:phage shock protein A
MIKQVILDMQNQLLQVKTQVAISIADQHVLDKKLSESDESARQWMRRAELAVDKQDDTLARAAVERSMSYQSTAGSFKQQVEDQKTQVENLKGAAQTATEAGGGAVQKRYADRAAPALAGHEQSQRGRLEYGRIVERGGLRPHEAQGAAHRSHGAG